MKKIEKKISLITEKIEKSENERNKKLFINEMKKIGIERLPYAYSALKQFIDPETMKYHYNKHYKGYVKKLNDALSKKDYGDLDLEKIVKKNLNELGVKKLTSITESKITKGRLGIISESVNFNSKIQTTKFFNKILPSEE